MENNCFTCNKEYCRYAYPNANGEYKYNYKKLFDCRNHQYFFWVPQTVVEEDYTGIVKQRWQEIPMDLMNSHERNEY